jgi:hypothetical protein
MGRLVTALPENLAGALHFSCILMMFVGCGGFSASPTLMAPASSRRPCARTSATSLRMGVTEREVKQRIKVLASKTKNVDAKSSDDEAAIMDCIRQLEKANTCRAPVESPLLSGKWSLLYTIGKEGGERARLEGVIGSSVTEVSESSGKSKNSAISRALGIVPYGNFQDIYLDKGLVYNRAELGFLGQRYVNNALGPRLVFFKHSHRGSSQPDVGAQASLMKCASCCRINTRLRMRMSVAGCSYVCLRVNQSIWLCACM